MIVDHENQLYDDISWSETMISHGDQLMTFHDHDWSSMFMKQISRYFPSHIVNDHNFWQWAFYPGWMCQSNHLPAVIKIRGFCKISPRSCCKPPRTSAFPTRAEPVHYSSPGPQPLSPNPNPQPFYLWPRVVNLMKFLQCMPVENDN